MAGTLLKLHVQAGDEIKIGQPLAVVEAMKMENQLLATKNTTVASIEAAIGDFFALFKTITSGQEKGRLVQPQYGVSGYYARCGKDFVYWKFETEKGIAIVEILHEQMNIGDHLQKYI